MTEFLAEIFSSVPPWLRNTIALTVLVAGAALTIVGWRGHGAIRQPQSDGSVWVSDEPGSSSALKLGIILDLVGCVLLVLAGQRPEEKAGYRF